MNQTADIQTLSDQVAALRDQVASLESLIVAVHKATSKTRQDPRFLTWAEAGELLNTTAAGAKKRVERERARPEGFGLRVIRGGVNRADFQRWLAILEERNPARCDWLRAAQKHLEGR